MKATSLLLVLILASAAWGVDEKDLGPGVSVTVYNNDFGVVKERREMDLPAGTSWVKFPDVAALIDATSVAFSSLTDPLGTRVIEQNYEFDLVSASKLLDKYIDKPIAVVTRDGDMVEGTLMSSDGAQVILKLKDGSLSMVPRAENIKDIIFGKLPEGLLTKPTLVWRVACEKGGKHLIRVAYMTTGMDWRADYTLVLTEKEDAINWAGWVTVNNRTGTRFENAEIKLMAGDVHRVEARRMVMDELKREKPVAVMAGAAAKTVEEKAFAEYHLYTVTAPSTLNDQQTKQLEFVKRDNVAVQKKYFYRGAAGGWWSLPSNKVDVEIRFKNEKAVNMGVPLPAGVVRLYKRDWEGELQLLGTSNIEHTPKDEILKFAMGNAFDIIGERKVLAERRPSDRSYEEDVAIMLRNHKTEAVTLDVEETMWRSPAWELTQQSAAGAKRDVRTMVWPVKVDANSEAKLTYTARYSW
jgi:hypothetical protein